VQPALAIFGGTFDPIHFGHLRAAQEVSDSFGLERVIFMPCAQPAHIKDVRATTSQRLQMVALAIAGNARFEVSDLEARRPGSSYAVDTLLELGKIYPGRGLLSILGADAFFQIHTWRQAGRLFQLADFVVMDRPGTPRYDILTYLQDNINPNFEPYGDRGALLPGGGRVNYLTTTLLDISSSEIKRKAGRGQALTYLVPPEVENYIKSAALYQ
jgi:nicotinate-nucleotide adenylyltransferase